MKALTLILTLLAASAHAQELPRYSAHEVLQRAQVGTSSPRLAPPVRVHLDHVPARLRKAAEVERMTCRENPAEPKTIICEPRRGP